MISNHLKESKRISSISDSKIEKVIFFSNSYDSNNYGDMILQISDKMNHPSVNKIPNINSKSKIIKNQTLINKY